MLTGYRRHLTVQNGCALGKVTVQSALEPEMLHSDLLCSFAAHRLHKLSLLPLLPPHLPFLLSLTLTQWDVSVVGGFYLCSQAGCRHGEGCSAPEDYVLVRAYASERPHLRPEQPESLFPDPTQDLRPESSQGNNRQQPSSAVMPLFEGEQILLGRNAAADLICTCIDTQRHKWAPWLASLMQLCGKFIKDWTQGEICCMCECVCYVHGCVSAYIMFLHWVQWIIIIVCVCVCVCVCACFIHTFSKCRSPSYITSLFKHKLPISYLHICIWKLHASWRKYHFV